ncbi:MAG: hypothetical protein LBU67_09670 [Oscillospiraceae bacterium]|jgi:hypothetical protein|nr:hypothetical protein [Oscillospiraceae bacterium]
MRLFSIKKQGGHRAVAVSIVIFAAIIALATALITGMDQRVDKERTTRLADALRRASVTCYAVEGRYPSSLDYLVEHYGVVVDTDKFIVNYDVFAQNIMPKIEVIWVEGAAG